MLFNKPTLDGLEAGTVSATYRRWTTARARPGSRFTTRAGVVEVTAVTPLEPDEESRLTDADARAAGFADVAALRTWTAKIGSGTLHRIEIRLAGPDPRVALRASAELSPAELVKVDAALNRMDRAAPEPWTRQVLDQIRRQPATVSTELAAAAGQPRDHYKIRVRRLKALGLTESLEIGYRLSPRGIAYLAWARSGSDAGPDPGSAGL